MSTLMRDGARDAARWLRLLGLCLVLCGGAIGSGCSADSARHGGSVTTDDAGAVQGDDADGDGIADRFEGREENRDTDGDGVPDYLDEDSDGDGIPDAQEAGDDDPGTPPYDSDGDGLDDFVDFDSDDNGILDADEVAGDADGDGALNAHDLDDDGDGIPDVRELALGAAPPVDTDQDGIPNYLDPDSDNDTIKDGQDGEGDTDGDGLADWLDGDADNDGVPDIQEAGDGDIHTPPIDTDGDGLIDARDPDSDNDGLSDSAEVAAGTSPRDEDSDGDGVSDLIEVAAGTNPRNASDNPQARGDFVFIAPYESDPMPTQDTLNFKTSLQFADVYFLMDITASMQEEIQAMGAAVEGIVNALSCESFGTSCMLDQDCGDPARVCGPSGQCIANPTSGAGCIPSLYTGVGTFAGTYASYRNQVSLQGDAQVTRAAIPSSANGGGATEPLFQSVQYVYGSPYGTSRCVGGGVGCPGFRKDAARLLVTVTDEPDQCGDGDGDCGDGLPQHTGYPETASEAAAALTHPGEEITFVGINAAPNGSEARDDLIAIAEAAQSYDAQGAPLVFDGANSDVVDSVSQAIQEVAFNLDLRVTIDAEDQPNDAGDALPFIDYLVVNESAANCTDVSATEDTNADSHDDAFPALRPGTPVCWDVVAKRNTFVTPTLEPQMFRARLSVRGDGSELDSRDVFFLVPPRIPQPGAPE